MRVWNTLQAQYYLIPRCSLKIFGLICLCKKHKVIRTHSVGASKNRSEHQGAGEVMVAWSRLLSFRECWGTSGKKQHQLTGEVAVNSTPAIGGKKFWCFWPKSQRKNMQTKLFQVTIKLNWEKLCVSCMKDLTMFHFVCLVNG